MTTVRIQLGLLLSVFLFGGCQHQLMQTEQNQQLGVAVQPIRNESGWAGLEADRATDMVAERLARDGNLFVPPTDRVRAALAELGLERARTPAELDRLADVLGVQTILSVSITACDPYPPFVMGLEGVLHERRIHEANPLDPVQTDASPFDPGAQPAPELQASRAGRVFDARDADTASDAKTWSRSRVGHDAPLKELDSYFRYAADRLLEALMATKPNAGM
ncbi:MAG: hypothetical protein CMJ28_05170 [Phycisphaerae bacterium]|nr:hypothetical protein [Phycisphaerae bacterium]